MARRFDPDSGRAVASQQAQQDEVAPEDRMLPCRWCGRLEKWKFLSLYGARCTPCYGQWQREGSTAKVLTPEQKAQLLKRLGGARSELRAKKA